MNKGFTLIEILVACTIFLIVVTVFADLIGNVFEEQRHTLEASEVLNSASYTVEYMARSLRMAQKDRVGECIVLNENYQVLLAGTAVRFLNYNGKCQQFTLSGSQIVVDRSSDSSALNFLGEVPLTPSNLLVEGLQFRIIGNQQTDEIQPKTTFVFTLKPDDSEEGVLYLQTTVSQRQLDVVY